MSEEQQQSEGERVRRFAIVYALPPSAQGTYEYERKDGTIVQGDASGEWILDEKGRLRTSCSSPPRA